MESQTGQSATWLSLLGLLLNAVYIYGHPQCLDYRPPFRPSQPITFCTEYKDFGCCTLAKDQELRERYESLKQYMAPACLQYAKTILCQECSPYAAHLYDAETTQQPKALPGLCPHYCFAFFHRCWGIVNYLTGDVDTLYTLTTPEDFCRKNMLSDMDYCYPDILSNQRFSGTIDPVSVTSEGCLCVEEVAWGFHNPVAAVHAGDNSRRLFIAEQIGKVHILTEDYIILEDPFLDIQDSVLTSEWEGDERGFLGIAFHPRYKDNGKFYVYYSNGFGFYQNIRISEFKVSDNDTNRANHSSERILFEIEQPYWNHNGGMLMFGLDGFLYIFTGDGGGAGDPQNNSQNKSSLLGKVLRVDVDKQTGDLPYSIPEDNPFINVENAHPEIFAYGVRNMWRCSVDRGDFKTGEGRGRIICGDVGQNAFEEIDIIEKGGNYGWNAREGFHCYKKKKCNKIGPQKLPIFEYTHKYGKSVTGGYVYRGCESPNLQGFYFFGDFVTGRMFRLKENTTTEKWENKEVFLCGKDMCNNGLEGTYKRKIISFGEDEKGELHLLSTSNPSTNIPAGSVYKIIDPRRRGDPSDCEVLRQFNFTSADQNLPFEINSEVKTNDFQNVSSLDNENDYQQSPFFVSHSVKRSVPVTMATGPNSLSSSTYHSFLLLLVCLVLNLFSNL